MWQKIKPYILIFPAMLTMGGIFAGGIVMGLLQSLGMFAETSEKGITFKFYIELLKSEEFRSSLFLTFKVAAASTLISGFAAAIISAALFCIEKKRRSRRVEKLLYLPVLFPHVIAAYLILVFFMKSGWLSSILFSLGIIDNMGSFPDLVNDVKSIGIIITYVWKETPFLLLMLLPVLRRIEDEWINMARSLGADRFDFFKEVAMPISLPVLINSMLIVFAFTFSDFEVPYLLGVTYPKFVSVYAYQIYSTGEMAMRPVALAANILLAVVAAIIGLMVVKTAKKYDFDKKTSW